ncbi:MAG: hypothetical protein KGZ25_13260, partial [Planctomycetes bacterium]|nr:hypothetical protein [Planctomycetota bacterium]
GSDKLTFEEIESLIANGSVKVRFYAADGDGSQEEHLRFTTNNLAPTTDDPTGRICRVYSGAEKKLMILGDGDSDQENCYEVYVPSSRFRAIGEIAEEDDDKHTTKWAHFELAVELAAGENQMVLLESEPDPSENAADRITLFGDKEIAAWDMRDDDFAPDLYMFPTSKGASIAIPGQANEEIWPNPMCTELAHWENYKGYDDMGALMKWKMDWCCTKENEETEERDTKDNRVLRDVWGVTEFTDTFTYKMPYWKVGSKGKTGTEFATEPHVRRVKLDEDANEIIEVLGDPRPCFKYCQFTAQRSGNNFTATTRMKQTGNNTYKGEYVSKNCGTRLGGYAIASYGGKNPPCFEDSDLVPAPWAGKGKQNVKERAMDLDKRVGKIKMTVGHGSYLLETFNNKDDVITGTVVVVNMGFALAEAALGLTQQYWAVALVGAAHVGVNAAMANQAQYNGGKRNASSKAKVASYYMWHDVDEQPELDGKTGWKVDSDAAINDNSPRENELISWQRGDGMDIEVGKQLTMWIDITSHSQLIAADTNAAFGFAVHHCGANANYTTPNPGQIEINVYEPYK